MSSRLMNHSRVCIAIILVFCLWLGCSQQSEKKGLKVFIVTDMEGVAGVFNFEDWAYDTGKFYEKARQLTTREVSAAVQGAIEGGATEVVVLDGHGAGAINCDELHPEAKLITGGGYDYLALLDSTYDAAFMVGQHPMALAPGGNMDHSWSSRTIHTAWLNDREIGEIGVNTIWAGYYGVPMVFLSGDTAACREMQTLVPDAVTVAVKEGLSRASAKSLSPQKACELIRKGVREAVINAHTIKPYFVAPPYTLKYQYHTIEGDGKYHLPKDAKILPDDKMIQANDFLELLRKR